jgi:hypothetical protein
MKEEIWQWIRISKYCVTNLLYMKVNVTQHMIISYCLSLTVIVCFNGFWQ